MLIRPNGRDRTDFTPARSGRIRSKKSDAPELLCKTLPDGTDGRRIPSPKELAEMLSNPKMQSAIDTVEREYGTETMVKRMVRTQFKRDQVADLGIRTQVRAINLAMKKQRERQGFK